MKEFVYSFYRYGYFLENSKSNAAFDDEKTVKLIIKPTEYELKISDEVLKKASCKGYIIEITNKGAVRFCDVDNTLIAELNGADTEFKEFNFEWFEDKLRVCFGQTETVDNYPNCDGEYDRWSTTWVGGYEAVLYTENNTATAKAL